MPGSTQRAKRRREKVLNGTRAMWLFVMAGLVPAIHDLLHRSVKKDADARDKPGHGGLKGCALAPEPF